MIYHLETSPGANLAMCLQPPAETDDLLELAVDKSKVALEQGARVVVSNLEEETSVWMTA